MFNKEKTPDKKYIAAEKRKLKLERKKNSQPKYLDRNLTPNPKIDKLNDAIKIEESKMRLAEKLIDNPAPVPHTVVTKTNKTITFAPQVEVSVKSKNPKSLNTTTNFNQSKTKTSTNKKKVTTKKQKDNDDDKVDLKFIIKFTVGLVALMLIVTVAALIMNYTLG